MVAVALPPGVAVAVAVVGDCVVSNVMWYVPLITPVGKLGNVGTVVATPALSPGGAQQWMCAIVLGLTRSLNVTSTRRRCALGSSATSAVPVPDESFGGTSAAPLSTPLNVAAWAGRLPTTKMTTARSEERRVANEVVGG